jgi:hypothetical protein
MARLAHPARLSCHPVALARRAQAAGIGRQVAPWTLGQGTGCPALRISRPNTHYAGVSVFQASAQAQTTPEQVLRKTAPKQALT